MRPVTLAATQMSCTWDIDDNIARAEAHVRKAAEAGAQVILLQELFETPYFCQLEENQYLELARPMSESRVVKHFSALAKTLGVVLPISYYERAGQARYNALAIADADGTILGGYRKTHIPQSPGYQEKFYFSPGDTGFQVFDTRFGRVGCGICWDQWFPETARALALRGAEMLLFPTAIGSEPHAPELDSAAHWRRTMQGHAAANMMPLVASNRVGTEVQGNLQADFYGTSFIAGYTGEILTDADRSEETVLTATVDLDEAAAYRGSWGPFRDRRPSMYGALQTLDGVTRPT
ncbi:N-carbamoylputrescine amidase [Roseovarius sp. LXJ103]|uniref:N-carbamoylputrescine amidase n=1 Tax=Roseovarius carneus TaxID=2853164 RepID=UPI000D60D55B|nr:N-carbamoylputrescine amidase [Roseovarius carneus]MBZ8119165.1 N-carbamoylputrescine amidase [Roseovarius carneus]PWE35202.1 N-carbamoylputrescine amidase [Pelagicola sp. LXJ1103]